MLHQWLRYALGSAGALLALSGSFAAAAKTVDSTILILARDEYGATSVSSGLDGYGIPWEKLLVPQEGVDLPTLNSTDAEGSYGGIVIVGDISYEYNGTWASAISNKQWSEIHAYQSGFKVRMVRLDEYPGEEYGTTTAIAGAGCCDDGVEQLISLSDTSEFPTANLKTDAGVTTQGLWHYPATITDTNSTTTFAKFAPGGSFEEETTAAVINRFVDREQMVWFIGWAPDWSATSAFLQHSYIHWMTRGLFVGKRKHHLDIQVDDLQISTELYLPAGEEFKIQIADLEAHVEWVTDLNSRLPSGSDFWLELGHNGNGDIISATDETGSVSVCEPPYAVDYPYPPDTPLEWMKPPGTGTDLWPEEFENYTWADTCAQLDPFASWFLDTANLNAFAHVSHTFTHEELNNATYHDAAREIYFNQAWMKQMGIDQAERFSANSIIPPAITGLHNADAIQAWLDNGIKYVVGDNTRPVLLNTNRFHPLLTTVESNGLEGLYILPREATTIYYNCATPNCTLQEWKDTSAGQGEFTDLLNDARQTNTRNLWNLRADPYMFHQANMAYTDAESHTIGDQTGKMSLLMTWVETVTQEMTRLSNWPSTSMKLDDIAAYFIDRMTLDACEPKLSYNYADDGTTIQSVTVSAKDNTCSVPVPVTIPGAATVEGATSTEDKVGSEPLILWLTLDGTPATVSLSEGVST